MGSLRVGGDGEKTTRATHARIPRRARAALSASRMACVGLSLQSESSIRNTTMSNCCMSILIYGRRILRQASGILPIDLQVSAWHQPRVLLAPKTLVNFSLTKNNYA